MSDDQDYLPSAYLDDEMSAAERRDLDASFAAVPTRVDQLHDLATVRDLVAGLSRPSCANVAPSILSRISDLPRSRKSPQVLSNSHIIRALAGGLAAAAILGIAFSVKNGDKKSIKAKNQDVASSTKESIPGDVGPKFVPSPRSADAGEPVGPVSVPQVVATKSAVGAARELFDRVGGYRVFLVTTTDGAIDVAEATAQLRSSSHRDFYRFEGEDGVSVFAAEVDPNEMETLRRRLNSSFAGRVEEKPSEASIMSDVLALGRSSTFHSEPAGEVLFPDGEMALRTPGSPGERVERPKEVVDRVTEVGPGPRDAVSSPQPDDRPTVALIWLVGSSAP